MNQEESPNMDKAQGRITFFTTSLNYTVQVAEEYVERTGLQPAIVIPAKLIRFVGGNYSTDDERTIKLIRGSKPYRRGKITEENKKEVLEKATVRGPITSASMRKEAGVEEKPQAMAIQEGGTRTCPHCDYVTTDDFSGRKMQGHKMGKHRLGMRPKKIEEKIKK